MPFLHADGLALLLMALTTLVVGASALHGARYLRESEAPRRRSGLLWPLLVLLWAALCSLFASGHLVVQYLALEVTALCAVALMLLPGSRASREAGRRYLLCTLSGSLLVLPAVVWLASRQADLSLAALAEVDVAPWWLALVTAGLLIKMAAFPLHGWLPPAHGAAWVSVSTVHAALVIKAAFFMAVSLWTTLAPEAASGAQLLGWLGAAAILWGSLLAWRQTELKSVVAYSTVAQVGYLLLLFPLLFGTDDEVATLAWQSTWLLVISHALAKAAMFMAVGSLVLAMGRGDLQGLSGVGQRLPLSLLVFGLAAVSLLGLPPSGGFTAKWMLLHAAILAHQWQWVLVVGIGTLLGAAYVFRVFRYCFIVPEDEQAMRVPPVSLDIIALLLALAAMGLGLAAAPVVALMGDAP
ncbi:multisubunit sodium/proton antiporter, MrpD subunit [Franzmannia pantelleriensis]|uniref:Multisubunit sodium/proton antiporter, MrpD subunit n=1 Tax=Franzmannia pantelleriensis TaxID=48727 RepID=A0A1G9R4K9_9GAMM|nr:proton-conducting transporter membrane subunit [Halomonas pantelleriensis]SDM18236.1 multisubunit sodium/proton antiporter, MrpD subunit [Halomonas pantelleriensis]